MPAPVSSLATAFDPARLYPWQVDHYIVRGGPNDPVMQSTPALPAAQTGGGTLSWNSTVTLPPVPGSTLNRTMTMNSTGTLANGQLGSNTGGIFVGTIPQGSWLQDIELFCYASRAGGTSTSIGIFYTPSGAAASVVYPVTPLSLLAYITNPAAGTLYGIKGSGGSAVTAFTAIVGSGTTAGTSGLPIGPGDGVANAAPAITQLASLSDIDIYVASFLIAGSGTAPTGGCYSLFLNFTGLEG